MNDSSTPSPRVSAWLSLFAPPADFPWNSATVSSIESRRAAMSDLLIFDVLLLRGGIRAPDMLYPPTNYDDLRKLLEAIEDSVYDGLKQGCLVYILLKWFGDGRDAKMAEEQCIAPQFVMLADAYWMLDTGDDLSKAVSILSDARLNRDYVSKILQALSLSPLLVRSSLIVRYVRTAKPPLIEPDDIDLYALALAETSGPSPESNGGGSLLDVWAYTRTFPEDSQTRERLLKKVLTWCLTPNPRPTPLSQLIGFPLSAYERGLLHTFALNPPSDVSQQGLNAIRDLVCVRLVQEADWVGAIRIERQFSAFVSAGQNNGLDTASTERRRMIEDISATLPPSERALLEAEMGGLAMGISRPSQLSSLASQSAPGKAKTSFVDLSMSMSWEEVPSPSPRASVGTSVNGQQKAIPTTPGMRARASLNGNLMKKQSLFGSTSLAESSAPTGQHQASPFSSVAVVAPLVGTSPGVSLSGPSSLGSGHPFTAFGGDHGAGNCSSGTSVLSTGFQTHPFRGGSIATPSKSRPIAPTSLFEKSGSAKYAPNAFYKPPATQGRSLFGASTASLTASTSHSAAPLSSTTEKYHAGGEGGEGKRRHEAKDDQREDANISGDENEFITNDVTRYGDVGMDMDMDEEDVNARSRPILDGREAEAEGGLGFSIFGKTGSWNGRASWGSGTAHETKTSPQHQDPETKKRESAPPGAFHTEESTEEGEHEGEVMVTSPPRRSTRALRHRPSQHTASPSPPPARNNTRTKTHTRSDSRRDTIGHGRKKVKGRESLAQSIPGSLLDEDDDEEEVAEKDGERTEEDDEGKSAGEEEDDVAPLPLTRSSRLPKGRPSRAKTGSTLPEAKTPQRRSSRLSTASSVASLSPELSPPAKSTRASRKSARASTANVASVGTRSSTRRKRS
ncbi:nuclear pore complex assembly-domain-containing protein [Phlebopus sp. FC_14]|nr:nuclear pore complex assembly-domain-containing protein [Phlebopus sp. FC_14]